MSMSRVQIIRTPGGERLAVLPAEDYEALVDAAADELTPEEEDALAKEMRRLRAEDRGDALPAESFRRILAGESPVAVWREHRGLSPEELAEKADLSPTAVLKAETSLEAAPAATLRAIARALGIALDDLASPEGPA
jgi:hypothetical protein